MTSSHDWFDHGRLGLFIHWGLYSAAARHEWVMSREQINVEDYDRYREHFDPDLYDPHEWAATAKAAGMRYAVLTTKHHDGFCLWDSDLSDWTVANTPYGKDLVGPWVEAFRAAGLKIGFYHSLIDWHHRDFTIDANHPRRDDQDALEQNATRDMDRYREYLHGQVRELLTRYGTIDYLFYDFSYPDHEYRGMPGKGRHDWDSDRLEAMTRELQPNILINDRLDQPQADLVTPEQYQPSEPMTRQGVPVRWEACQTLNGSWGYDRDNHDYKAPETLIRMLVDGVAKDGNLLLNVGPTARGTFDPRARESLAAIGAWMRLHERAVIGAGPSAHTAPPDARYTQRGNRLYLHLFAWPLQHVHLPGLAGKIRYAQLLNDASEVQFSEVAPDQQAQNMTPSGQPAGTVTLTLPVQRPDVALPVVEIFLG